MAWATKSKLEGVLFSSEGILNWWEEKGITEEIEGPKEESPGIVPGLKTCNEESILPDGVWVVGDLHVRVEGVGSPRGMENVEYQRVFGIDRQAG